MLNSNNSTRSRLANVRYVNREKHYKDIKSIFFYRRWGNLPLPSLNHFPHTQHDSMLL